MDNHERQIAETLDGIRADHKFRYEWAASILPEGDVLDACSGIGYGSYILALKGFDVLSIEKDIDAVKYGHEHYAHRNVDRLCADIRSINTALPTVMFECIEHIENPLDVLKHMGDMILASVPNQSVVPYDENNKYHYRHYTKDEFQGLLEHAGYVVNNWYGQKDIFSDVESDIEGQTLIAYAERI